MRIAIYSGNIPSSSFIENVIVGMADKGHTVLLFGQKTSNVKYKSQNVVVRPTPQNALVLMFFVLVSFIHLLFKRRQIALGVWGLLKQEKIVGFNHRMRYLGKVLPILLEMPDLFHVQWIKTGHNWLFLKKYGVKIVASFRGSHINYSPVADPGLAQLYRDTFGDYDGFHAVSETIKNTASQYFVRPMPVTVIPGAVPNTIMGYEFNNKRERYGKLKILSIGRDHWVKGYLYAVDACKLLQNAGLDFEYTIIGGSGSEELLYHVHDIGLQNNVMLKGLVPYAKVWDLYKNCDLFFLSSVDEGIANVVLEAMAMGVPVLSTDCGGMSEVIDDGVNGWLVPVRDAQSVADKILEINAVNPEELSRISKLGRETIIRSHLVSDQLERYAQFYKGVLGE